MGWAYRWPHAGKRSCFTTVEKAGLASTNRRLEQRDPLFFSRDRLMQKKELNWNFLIKLWKRESIFRLV